MKSTHLEALELDLPDLTEAHAELAHLARRVARIARATGMRVSIWSHTGAAADMPQLSYAEGLRGSIAPPLVGLTRHETTSYSDGIIDGVEVVVYHHEAV